MTVTDMWSHVSYWRIAAKAAFGPKRTVGFDPT
ncbi:hypothetical protein DSM25558_2291 [Agrobacterium sp. DSM 25558]|nr:hypothetical protein DSM25558_2291 [Agrobacterium sp. DSM 25558]